MKWWDLEVHPYLCMTSELYQPGSICVGAELQWCSRHGSWTAPCSAARQQMTASIRHLQSTQDRDRGI